MKADWDIYDAPPWGFGSAHYVSDNADGESIVDRLHKVVDEVTGSPVEKPVRKIGFY